TSRSTRTLLGGAPRRPSSRRLAWFVRRHMNLAELKCSFCLAGIDKDTGTLGADAGICHACVNRAVDRLETGTLCGPQRSTERSNDETRCDFCYTRTAASSTLFT